MFQPTALGLPSGRDHFIVLVKKTCRYTNVILLQPLMPPFLIPEHNYGKRYNQPETDRSVRRIKFDFPTSWDDPKFFEPLISYRGVANDPKTENHQAGA
jgi:hypothetical protein